MPTAISIAFQRLGPLLKLIALDAIACESARFKNPLARGAEDAI